MVSHLTLDEVLEKAVRKEIESQNLYTDLSHRVKEPAARDAFQEMVRQERRHQEMLERYRRGEFKEGALSRQGVIDYRIAEHFDGAEATPNMPLRDVFLLAANREKMSHEFYLNLAAIHPAGEVKRLLEDLAGQELSHKQRVEFLYTEVAFPQTDGG
ncbi:MAG: ferritin family protein [Dehalococcoidales bacterium]|nr:ferritin family protein [Dehalococcoidales bacterium]MDZ4230584.1 ferritin family protein [Dehalococcoidales bacterium]